MTTRERIDRLDRIIFLIAAAIIGLALLVKFCELFR